MSIIDGRGNRKGEILKKGWAWLQTRASVQTAGFWSEPETRAKGINPASEHGEGQKAVNSRPSSDPQTVLEDEENHLGKKKNGIRGVRAQEENWAKN